MTTPAKKTTILETIYAQRAKDVELAKSTPGTTPADLTALLSMNAAPPLIRLVSRLNRSPAPPALMAEIKRASPSKGNISLLVNPARQALTYALAGASVISVLTEPTWFKGSLLDLQLARQAVDALPDRPAILRKEFILDEYQITEARLHGADTVLLIVAMLPPARLSALYNFSLSLGMEPLVEVNNATEMKVALDLGAKVIGINNRNLHDFQVDMDTTSRLATMVREQDVFLCALSGISSPKDVQIYKEQGVRAVLVGEALMRAPDVSVFIRELFQWPKEIPSGEKKPWVQVSGITTQEQATTLMEAGVDILGFVFDSAHPRHVTLPVAIQISTTLRALRSPQLSHTSTSTPSSTSMPTSKPWFTAQQYRLTSTSPRPVLIGIFKNQPLDVILQYTAHAQLDLVQLDGNEPAGWIKHIPVPVVRTFHLAGGDHEKSYDRNLAELTRPGVHAFARLQLQDSYPTGLDTGEAARLVEAGEAPGWPMPVILAIGRNALGPELVEKTLEVGAWAIDIELGADSAGAEIEAVRAFVQGTNRGG